MMTIEPFKAEHVLEIDAQEAQAGEIALEQAREHELGGPAYTARINGRIVLCGGIRQDGGAGYLWAIVARGASMIVLHRCASRFIAMFPALELIATARCGFPAAGRWLRMLGFVYAKPLPADSLDGADQDLYYRGGTR